MENSKVSIPQLKVEQLFYRSARKLMESNPSMTYQEAFDKAFDALMKVLEEEGVEIVMEKVGDVQ